MKRDWDLIRKQLTDIEEESDVFAELPKKQVQWLDGETEADFLKKQKEYDEIVGRILGHLELLVEAGYVEGISVKRGASGDLYYSRSSPRLTMDGHDLLDTMRSATIWNAVKETAKKKGLELTFDAIKLLAGAALKQVVGG
ncbi:DUF2513 domain-containing protein [Herbaspirillum autotrophicum]|uniref:DUF2513 domain-containing protein n=1 Tax=Herbaspirillum autotrophicum TaxID=180195 RepID=UPI00067B4E46|nr:DUF2513 domain-containing protein [Herbaspirillum autotrophicum]